MDDRRRPRGTIPVHFPESWQLFQQHLLAERFGTIPVIPHNHARITGGTRLYHGPRQHEGIRAQGINARHQRRVPARAAHHVIIEVDHIGKGGQGNGLVECVANADVFRGMRVPYSLGTYPFQRAIAAIIDVQDHLEGESREPFQAAKAELQQRKVVPGRDDN